MIAFLNESVEPRLPVGRVPPAVHGARDFAELQRMGLRAQDVLDFSANVNPFGPAPEVFDAVKAAPLDGYADRECRVLRHALAENLAHPTEQILPGNGVSELIWLTAIAFLRPRDAVLVLGPTYSEYARAAALLEARVIDCRATEDSGFACDVGAVEHLLHSVSPRLIFICNPNNPTGAVIPPEVIATWARQTSGSLFVVDESYASFAVDSCYVMDFDVRNLLVLRSMTKDFALAGLRLGYAVGHEEIVAALRQAQPPWSVSAVAQAGGIAALQSRQHMWQSLNWLREATSGLVAGLRDLGLAPCPSAVHFVLVKVGNGATFRHELLKRGMLVRDCASFGLTEYVRIAARRPDENARLLCAMREVL